MVREKPLLELTSDPSDKRHGTLTGYSYGCRCSDCRETNRVYVTARNRALGIKPIEHVGDMSDPGNPRHGTLNGYINLGCRCSECRKANAKAVRDARSKRSLDGPDDPRHGTENGYANYNCRCQKCTAVNTAAASERTKRRKARRP